MPSLCRGQSIDLPSRMIGWFLYDGNISHLWVNANNSLSLITLVIQFLACQLYNFWQGGNHCFEIVYSFNYAILVVAVPKIFLKLTGKCLVIFSETAGLWPVPSLQKNSELLVE